MRYPIVRSPILVLAGAIAVSVLSLAGAPAGSQARSNAQGENRAVGQSITRLSDGRWLVVGGMGADGPSRAIVILGTTTGGAQPARYESTLVEARSWHSATVLPDGRVLIAGGVGTDSSLVETAELFDPESGISLPISWTGTPRAHHTATLLRNGQVLFAGGVSSDGEAVPVVETFDPATWNVQTMSGSLVTARQDHSATLLPDGRVRLDGGHASGSPDPVESEIYHPGLQVSRPATQPEPDMEQALVAAAAPANGSQDVPADVRLWLHFSKPIAVESLQRGAVRLDAVSGNEVGIRTVLAEGGRLLFVIPEGALSAGQQYLLNVEGLFDTSGVQAATVALMFRVRLEPAVTDRENEEWTPAIGHGWQTGRDASAWQALPPLRAAPGVTALSGQVLLLNGRPLPDVTLKLAGKSAVSDRTGRFLISDVPAGAYELLIDGRTASVPGRTFGVFHARTSARDGETSVLPYTIWMPRIDTARAVPISSPLSGDLVVRTPQIPGLELHLPKGSVIRDHEGRVAREISITPIPVDRPPFALPTGVDVPVYFTIQPGGGFIETPNAPWPAGARVVYPNYTNQRPGTAFHFWNYDPEERGWHVYGEGTVDRAGAQVVPNPGVVIYRFTGTMIVVPGLSPPATGPLEDGPMGGEPVDLATGLFVLEKTDLYVADQLPLALTRTYRANDTAVRPFGIGTTHPYAIFLWSAQQYQEADLILPDGGRIHYIRISSGTGWTDAIFEHTATPGRFHKSRIVWNGAGWNLTLRDGTVYVFGANTPLQSIRDRHGNTIQLTWSNTGPTGGWGNILKVTSPNGRFLEFTYDPSNRITQAKDHIGRTVGYQYDASGRLWKVTDPPNGVTEYTYDTAHRMLTLKDARGIVYLTNEYDANGRVFRQTQADNTTFQFAYTLDGMGRVTQTDVTDPRGSVDRWTFNASAHPTSHIEAVGVAQQRTTTWTRDSATNRVTRTTDGLGRHTDYGYDSLGNVTSVMRLASTAEAVTTSYTYESTFSQLTTITDPLSHTTTFTRDSLGEVTTLTDPLNHQMTFTYNPAGQVVTVTTPAGATQFGYDLGDLVSLTNPLGQVTTRFLDAVGRVVRVTNPLGQVTRYEYNAFNQVTKVIDPLLGETAFTYDPNGNLLTLTDARNNTTTYTYNNMDRVATRTDSLTRQESYVYDNNGNLSQVTDRKNQVTTYASDPLDRPTTNTYHDSSTTTYTRDAGDRLTQVVDSIAGTITRGYDGLDRLTSETTPEGSVSYTYDAASRRATMTVAGQPQVSYSYDNADRLIALTQSSATVGFTYDDADRRTVLTLPNGITVEYAYDAASQSTGLTYKLGSTTLGDLTYTYDATGNKASIGGSWARTGLPTALSSATYNAANQIDTWGGTAFTYDNNGNLTSDGTKAYTWNARDQLTGLSGGIAASFQYDGLGRRRVRTVSGTTTGFLYDRLNTIQELTSGSPSASILSGLRIDEWFTRTDGAGSRHLSSDVLGSTVALTDGSGTVQTQYTYEPFGSTAMTGASTSNTFGFTGRETDGTGLLYYRARYYHPTLQRFTAQDPSGFVQDTNLYSYVGNSPQSYVDPTGEIAWIPIIAGALAVVQIATPVVYTVGCLMGHCHDPHTEAPHTEDDPPALPPPTRKTGPRGPDDPPPPPPKKTDAGGKTPPPRRPIPRQPKMPGRYSK